MKSHHAKRLEPDRDATSEVCERELRALALNARAEILTTSMFERVLYPSRRRAQRRLRVLVDHELVRAHLQGDALHREQVYTVTVRGFDLLAEHGYVELGKLRPVRLPRPQRLAHALLTRAVYIECVAAEREKIIERVGVRFDDDLAAEPLYQAARLVPDALLALTRTTTVRVGVEVDRGTETTTTLREKFRRWKGVLDAAVEAQAVLPATLLVVVAGARRRVTVERIAHEALPAARVTVVHLDDLEGMLRSGWPHQVAAGARHTVAPQGLVFRPVTEAPAPTFRAVEAAMRRSQ